MKKRPLIGISAELKVDESGRFPGYRRVYVNEDYIKSVELVGGVPIIIPLTDNEENIKKCIERMDGLILSGGHDVTPLSYGEEPLQKLGNILPERDKFDLKLLKKAYELNKPILGICRGHQIINVFFGGNIYQDLSYIEGCKIKHDQYNLSNIVTHTVEVKENTILREVLGKEILTNSFHHQVIKDVAPGFIISAKAKDGVIEAIEKKGEQFILGVQWHPEMMAVKKDENMLKVFKKLIKVSSK
ncbi:MAG: gamma-glutamyl-gamma-aminobutyrate hydrolase family protein [Firmicutes bacterium]|nr:gamma-glutamyl-gamma-aminobutyrate hydrolase family protein [Bacillota bacterium]